MTAVNLVDLVVLQSACDVLMKLYSVVLPGTLNSVWQTTFDLNQIQK